MSDSKKLTVSEIQAREQALGRAGVPDSNNVLYLLDLVERMGKVLQMAEEYSPHGIGHALMITQARALLEELKQ